jgi:2-methylisocitrate lyase-like PEP mutase family enzyme
MRCASATATFPNHFSKWKHRIDKAKAPLILFNIWDAGSALAVAKSGAHALATGSWSISAANGYTDA